MSQQTEFQVVCSKPVFAKNGAPHRRLQVFQGDLLVSSKQAGNDLTPSPDVTFDILRTPFGTQLKTASE